MKPADSRRPLLAKVHLARKELALTEESYRDLLATVTGQRSAAKLTLPQLAAVIERFKALGFEGKSRTRPKRPPGEGLQASKVRALWLSLWNLGAIPDVSEKALAGFVRRQTGIEVGRMLPDHYGAVIEALKKRLARAGVAVPDAATVASLDAARRGHGLEPGGEGLAWKAAVINAQWRRLAELETVKGEAARLEVWLMAQAGVTAPHFLAPLDADRLAAGLGHQLRQALAAKRREKVEEDEDQDAANNALVRAGADPGEVMAWFGGCGLRRDPRGRVLVTCRNRIHAEEIETRLGRYIRQAWPGAKIVHEG